MLFLYLNDFIIFYYENHLTNILVQRNQLLVFFIQNIRCACRFLKGLKVKHFIQHRLRVELMIIVRGTQVWREEQVGIQSMLDLFARKPVLLSFVGNNFLYSFAVQAFDFLIANVFFYFLIFNIGGPLESLEGVVEGIGYVDNAFPELLNVLLVPPFGPFHVLL